jgi:hypothetical protein
VTVLPDPGSRWRLGGQDGFGSRQVPRNRDLEIDRVTCDDLHGDASRLEQCRLVGPRLGPIGRVSPVGGPQDIPAHALRRLGETKSGPFDGFADDIAFDPLQRLRDGHDRDGRAVAGRLHRDPADEVRGDGRSGAVVHQHDPSILGAEAIECEESGGDRLLAPPTTGHDVDNRARQPR